MSYAVGTKLNIVDPQAIEAGYTTGEVVDISTLDPAVFDVEDFKAIQEKEDVVLVKTAVPSDDLGGFLASIEEGTPGFVTVGLKAEQVAAA